MISIVGSIELGSQDLDVEEPRLLKSMLVQRKVIFVNSDLEMRRGPSINKVLGINLGFFEGLGKDQFVDGFSDMSCRGGYKV